MTEKEFLRAVKYADRRWFQEANALAAAAPEPHGKWSIIMNRIWKFAAAAGAVLACGAGLFVLIDRLSQKPADPKQPLTTLDSDFEQTAPGESSVHETEPSGESGGSAADVQAPVAVGEGLYQVFSLPKLESEKPALIYGEAPHALTSAGPYTLDFSTVTDTYNCPRIPYCVQEQTQTVIFINYLDVYRADLNLQSNRRELFSMMPSAEHNGQTLPTIILELIALQNTELVLFRGYTAINQPCFGSIDPETGAVSITKCSETLDALPCKNGVLLYERGAFQSDSEKTVYYWECGEVYSFTLGHARETEYEPVLSPHGKYLCTVLKGKTKEGKLTERYSVYDIHSGTLLRTLDRDFPQSYENGIAGFKILGIDEDAQCVYLEDRKTLEFYRFDFGEAPAVQNAAEPVSVGENMYQVFSLPQFAEYAADCTYGTVFSDHKTATAYWHTLDFSDFYYPGSDRDRVSYCMPKDQSALYVAHYDELWRSDTELQEKELLLKAEGVIMFNVLTFPNTDLLFFSGSDGKKPVIGSIDTEKGDIRYSVSEGYQLTPCNTGVLISDVDVKRVYYWERGEVYEIPLTNGMNESNHKFHISANGKYLCTFMDGKSRDGKLINRCTVYDVKTGKVLRQFDWTTHLEYGKADLCQLEFLGFDETAQQVYVKELETLHLLRFDFGG